MLNQGTKIKFAEIRNDLYHALQGDVIDQALDQKTQQLRCVTHSDHPAQVAVGHLEFLIGLAGMQGKVQQRVLEYRRRFPRELESWDWWLSWISLRGFLARQERERQRWMELVGGRKNV